jgi:hypothetical protein
MARLLAIGEDNIRGVPAFPRQSGESSVSTEFLDLMHVIRMFGLRINYTVELVEKTLNRSYNQKRIRLEYIRNRPTENYLYLLSPPYSGRVDWNVVFDRWTLYLAQAAW